MANSFTSSDQTISSAGSLTIAHGLGVAPKFVEWMLVCQTAEHGYSAGDVLTSKNCSAGAQNVGMSIKVDATNLKVYFSIVAIGQNGCFQAIEKGGFGTDVYLTNANWKLRLYCEKATTSDFTSTDQTISANGTLTIAHGLGAAPKFVDFYLVCQTAEYGYSIGDVIVPRSTSAGTDNTGMSVTVDGTNIKVQFANPTSTNVFFAVRSDGTGTDSRLTNGSWKVRFYAVKTTTASTFTSTDQTITESGTLTIAHGLTSAPKFVKHYLICQTAENGFAVGAVLDPINTSIGLDGAFGCTIKVDGTNIFVQYANNNGGGIFRTIQLSGGTQGVDTLLTDSNWKLRLFASLAT